MLADFRIRTRLAAAVLAPMMVLGMAGLWVGLADTAPSPLQLRPDRPASRDLSETRRQPEVDRLILIGASLATSLLAAAALLQLGIGRPAVRITTALRRLSAGDTDAPLPDIAGASEWGAAARALAVLRGQLVDLARIEAEAGQATRDHAEHTAAWAARRASEGSERDAAVAAIELGLQRLRRGDLRHRIGDGLGRDYIALQRGYNEAAERLDTVIGVAAAASAGLHSDCQALAAVTSALDTSSRDQAEALESAATILTHARSRVQRTVEGASRAQDVVSAARRDAERSGVVVSEAVGAMGAIEQSARQINQIISVIDEIAFQTNLLALNAGVEAARAGDAGRGFAVVASEVRALAQRSADAAKEIKALISQSSDHVARGVGLVGETGKALDRIVDHVGDISDSVAEMAVAAEAQHQGLASVTAAVAGVERAAASQASALAQAAVTVDGLVVQSGLLARLAAKFRVGSPGAVAVTPAIPFGRRAA